MILNNFKNVYDTYNQQRKIKHLKPIGFRKLARITNTSRSSLYNLYRNKSHGIQFDTLDKLIKFFGVPITKLIKYRNNPYLFKLMNGTEIAKNPNEMTSHQKAVSRISVVLFSLDFKIPIMITPFPSMIPSHDNPNLISITLGYSTLNSNKIRNARTQAIINNFSVSLFRHIMLSVFLHSSFISSHTARQYRDYEWWGTIPAPTKYNLNFHLKGASMIGADHIKLLDIIKRRKSSTFYHSKQFSVKYTHDGFLVKSNSNQQKIILFDTTTPNFKN